MSNWVILSILVTFFAYSPAWGTAQKTGIRPLSHAEESERYFQKWMNEDVVYIITSEEKDILQKLSTAEEKEQFIEQFWLRRTKQGETPDDARAEHYRRIQYANEKFQSGKPGWMTDRGMVYIKLGKPDQLESHASGGTYQRTMSEGRGYTSTYPFEVWRYRHIDGIGDEIEIEFVDRSFSGKYEIAPNPWFKDAFTYVQGAGPTLGESLGIARRLDRPEFQVGTVMDDAFARWGGVQSSRENPFERMRRLVNLEKPPAIRFQDLKDMVTTRVSFEQLPIKTGAGFLLLGGGDAVATINVEIPNAALSYKEELGIFRSQVQLYGSISSFTNRRVREFEDTLVSEFNFGGFQQGRKLSSLYQKLVILPPGLYRVDLVLKDVNSGNVGMAQQRLSVPRLDSNTFAVSTLMIARDIRPVSDGSPERLAPFVLGDLRVIPNVSGEYRHQDRLKLMFQIYGATVEQSSLRPMADLEYLLYSGDKLVKQTIDFNGGLTQSFTGQYLTVVKEIALSDLSPGKYQLVIKARDTLTGKQTEARAPFSITPYY